MGKGATMHNEFADGLDDEAFEKYLDDLHQREDDNEPMDDSEFFTECFFQYATSFIPGACKGNCQVELNQI